MNNNIQKNIKRAFLVHVEMAEPKEKPQQAPVPEGEPSPIQDPIPGNEPTPGEALPRREPMILIVGERSQIFL